MDGTGAARAGFAAELARRRAKAGLSLADVATAAHGYVHHIAQVLVLPGDPTRPRCSGGPCALSCRH